MLLAGCCEHGNEHSRSIKGGEFLDLLCDFSFSRRTLLRGVELTNEVRIERKEVKEGRKEGRKDGRKDGRKEGRASWRQKGEEREGEREKGCCIIIPSEGEQ